jgi:putative transposase
MYTPFIIILDGAKVSPQGVMGDIEAGLREILHQIASDNGFTLSEIETDSDPLHPFIDCTPQHSIPNMIKAVKGVTNRLHFKEFPSF